MVAIAKPRPLLLERDAELAWLSALLEKAQAGSGAVAVISGPPGIGKTELLAAVHRLAGDRGFRSLRARGRELEADMAFSVVRQLLEQPVLSAPAGLRRRLLAGPARAGASALGLEPGNSPVSDFAAIHGLYWLCVNLAERAPLLLTVDDLQWVDRPSLSWLAYLGPRCEESPMLVVLSVREGDPRGRANLVGSAADHSSVHRVGLSALSAASVAALVRAELGSAASAEFCSRCWELAGGNPLFVRELLAAAHNEGLSGAQDSVPELRALASSAVGPSVLGRLARLGPDAAALAGLMDDRTAPAALRAVDRLEASLGEFADPPARVLVAIAHAATRRGSSPDEALQLIERVLVREPSPRPNASASIIVTLLGLEAFGTLQQLCDDMLRAARRRSAVQELMGVASFLAWASYRRGELADAEAQARWAVEHATGIWAIDAPAHLVEILVERDELDDAAAALGRLAPPLASHTVVVAAYLIGPG